MKRKNLLFIAVAAVGLFITSCAKVTPGKMDGNWNMTAASGSETSTWTNSGTSTTSTTSFNFDGTFWTETTDGVAGPPTEYTQYSYNFTKDNTWSRTSATTRTISGATTTTTITESGSWTILGADKTRDIKSGDRLNLTVANETVQVTTTISGVSNTTTDTYTYSGDQYTMVWMVTELTKETLTATTDMSRTYNDGDQYNENVQSTGTVTLTKE